MHRILLVDDDVHVIALLKKCVRWDCFDMEVVADAHDGKLALEYIKSNPVDVVFTDIKMPRMDGIDLIEQVHELFPSIVILALSSYGDVDLIKKSFYYGVIDYIMKIDIDNPKIMNALLSRINSILFSSDNCYNHDVNLATLICKIHIREDIRMDVLQLISIVIDIPDISTEMCITETLFELQKEHLYFVFSCSMERITLLVYNNNANVIAADVKRLIDHIIHILKGNESGSICFRIGLSSTADMKELGRLYNEAITANFYSRNSICVYSNKRNINHFDNVFHQALLVIKDAALTLDLLSIQNQILKVLEAAQDNQVAPDKLLNSMQQLINRLLSYIDLLRINLLKDDLDKAISLQNVKSFHILMDLCMTTIQRIKTALSIMSKDCLFNVVSSLIEQNHHNPSLSLGVISKALNWNTRYISLCIMESKGMHFKKYLNKVRMEKAAFLIKNTNLRVNEISDQVGYSNVEHFSRIFSKTYHTPPINYIKVARGGLGVKSNREL